MKKNDFFLHMWKKSINFAPEFTLNKVQGAKKGRKRQEQNITSKMKMI